MSDRTLATLADQLNLETIAGVTSLPNAAKQALQKNQRHIRFYFTDGGTAGTAQTETPVGRCDANLSTGWTVLEASVVLPISVTANNSNYATFTLNKRTSGGAAVVVAQSTTQITDPVFGSNATAFVAYPTALSATAANLLLAAGTDVLTFAVSKTGTGVALAAATSQGWVDVVVQET